MFRLHEAIQTARDTKRLELGRGVLARTAEVFREIFGDCRAIQIVDPNTWLVAGQSLANVFAKAKLPLDVFQLTDPKLYAEHGFVEQIESALRNSKDAIPIAVGAGTINDLVKLASHRLGRPYLCVATAASMDGYTAYGASITRHGSKQTFDCPAPRAVVADIDVIRAAPAHLNAAGYADLLAKVTAGADWILADTLGIEPIDSRAWRMVQSDLRVALADPAGVREGKPDAIERLTTGLMMGGFAMQAHQSSRPASGAEHQLSHLWDMQHHVDPRSGAAPSHGFKVGIGTLAVAGLYDQLLGEPIDRWLDIDRACAAWPASERDAEAQVRELFAGNDDLVAVALKETHAKYISRDDLRRHLRRVREVWPALSVRLREQLIEVDQLRAMLADAGAPVEPEQVGISRERLRSSFRLAYHIRRRYTVLDLAARAGRI